MNGQERCGYAVTDREGIEGPCDRDATSWRWYEDCGHEEVLEPACFWHENESGKKIHALTSRLASVEALADEWERIGEDGLPHGGCLDMHRHHAHALRAVLGSDAHTEGGA